MTDHVMLAAPSSNVAPSPREAFDLLFGRGWLFEPKHDGVRCVLHTKLHRQATLINRNGKDITFRYPDVVELMLERLPPGEWTLDGEIVSLTELGRHDFQALQHRDRRESAPSPTLVADYPATFIPFDLLTLDGTDIRELPYRERAGLLTPLAKSLRLHHYTPTNDSDWFESTLAEGFEGVMAKDPERPYRVGRSPWWVKIKHVSRATFVVRSYDPGEGSCAGQLGAMRLEVFDQGEFKEIGRVGTGFTDAQRTEFATRLDAGERLIVEVEYAEVTPAGALRFPSFKGLRSDVGIDGCTLAQLH